MVIKLKHEGIVSNDFLFFVVVKLKVKLELKSKVLKAVFIF